MLFFISATFFSMAHFNKQKRCRMKHTCMFLLTGKHFSMFYIYTCFIFVGLFDRSFSFLWWFWLSSTGMFMAGSFSVKFVGLFLVFLVGMRAIYDLWIILGDMSQPVVRSSTYFETILLRNEADGNSSTERFFLMKFLDIYGQAFPCKSSVSDSASSRSVCCHFLRSFEDPRSRRRRRWILQLCFPSESQRQHVPQFYWTPRYLCGPISHSCDCLVFKLCNLLNTLRCALISEVAYGAVIRVKNNVLEGQYLHSHRQLYPVGARQQQITTVYIRDPNNRWFIKRHNQSSPLWNATDPIDLVRNGDLIRIEHRTTGRNLHVHRGPAPISNKMYQVTGYGVVRSLFHLISFFLEFSKNEVSFNFCCKRGEGNDDDFWRLEIEGAAEGEVLEIVRHSFRLVSPNNKCVLTSTTKNLPEWGFGSAEVACNPKIHDDRAYWHIDDNRYPRRNETHFQLLRTQKLLIFIVYFHLLYLVPNVSYTIYELSFLERFIESHKNMFMGNAGFRPKISDFQSRPWMWPINFRVYKNQERFRLI